jgi:hypothetical protein
MYSSSCFHLSDGIVRGVRVAAVINVTHLSRFVATLGIQINR